LVRQFVRQSDIDRATSDLQRGSSRVAIPAQLVSSLTAAMPPGLSKTQVDRAGETIRSFQSAKPRELEDAIRVASAYRAGFADPLKKVTVGLRQFVERESSEIIVGQRLKRLPAMGRKLGQQRTMRLSQMEDVGGCRAILPGGHKEIAGVLRRIRRNWQVVNLDDYIVRPKSTGYRAIHVVVLRDKHRIEIQLRTPGQHEWAEAVERLAARTGYGLKYGQGPPDLLSYFELAAWAIDHQERELPGVDEDFMRVFDNLRERVTHYWTDPR